MLVFCMYQKTCTTSTEHQASVTKGIVNGLGLGLALRTYSRRTPLVLAAAGGPSTGAGPRNDPHAALHKLDETIELTQKRMELLEKVRARRRPIMPVSACAIL